MTVGFRGADTATVSDYLDLLEKAFVIFRLTPFARNLRNDVGALWENFIISNEKTIGLYRLLILCVARILLSGCFLKR